MTDIDNYELGEDFEKWLRQGAQNRVGRDFLIETVEPARTAVLNIDMQHYFISEGFQAACPIALDIIPALNKFNQAFRDLGGLCVWIQTSADNWAIEHWGNYAALQSSERWARRSLELREGHEGFNLHPDLETNEEDLFMIKTRFSAFIEGSSALDQELKKRGIDTVLITGVATGVCCESTARDAMMMNYRVIMVSDVLAAMSLEAHKNSLQALYGLFTDVQTTNQVLAHAQGD
jgi:ureidoacrylate peracid hydrolase